MKVTDYEIKKALGKRHRNEFFMTECKNGPTITGLLQFDAVAIYKSWAKPQIRGYEIKTSRSDFLRDNKYSQYLKYFHEFYFVVPTGLIQRQEVEENIGLIYYNPEKESLTTRRKAVRKDIEVDAQMLLYIIMNRLSSDRLPYASSKAEYWQDWLEHKISTKDLSYQVKSRLLEENMELIRENDRYRHWKQDRQELSDISQVLEKHGINNWGNMAGRIDEALGKGYPKRLDLIQTQLEGALDQIEKIKGGETQ